MTVPAEAVRRFGLACLIGLALGLVYGALRPLRRRHTVLADVLFVPVLFYAWLELSFRVCRGDIRLGCTAGLLLGAVAWEMTVGKLLRPVFDRMWKLLVEVFGILIGPVKNFFKKIRKFLKNILASWGKWVTMVENNRRSMRRKSGGSHGKQTQPPVQYQAGMPKKLAADEDRRVGGRRVVYDGAAYAPRGH